MPKGAGKKKDGIIDKIRRLIQDEPDSGDATGTGGRRRERDIDDAVEAMQTGIDDANADARRKKKKKKKR